MSCTPSTTSTTCTTGVVSHRGRRVYVAVGSRLLRVNRAVQRVAVATRVSTSLARQRIPHRPHILHIECKLARTTYRDSSASRCPSPGVDRTQAFNHPPPLYLSTLLTSLTSPHHPSPTCSRVRQRTRYTPRPYAQGWYKVLHSTIITSWFHSKRHTTVLRCIAYISVSRLLIDFYPVYSNIVGDIKIKTLKKACGKH